MLLDAAERAGITPIAVRRLHTFAFLSNVLAPVWDAPVFDGRLLKRRDGPFYPALQRDLDRLIGQGLAFVVNFGYAINADGQWGLDCAFSLNQALAKDALDAIDRYPEERKMREFLWEVAYALSALSDSEFDRMSDEDPTYSDAGIAYGNVVDFAEWRDINFSANAARHFGTVSTDITRGEQVHLYVRHLHRRLNGDK